MDFTLFFINTGSSSSQMINYSLLTAVNFVRHFNLFLFVIFVSVKTPWKPMVEIQKHVGLSETINENSFVFRDGMDVPCFIDAQKNVNCLVRDSLSVFFGLHIFPFRVEIKAGHFTKVSSRTLSGLYTSFTDLSTITFRIRCSTDQRGIGTTALKTSNPIMKYTLPKPCFKL